jgi:hypothetical protein
MNMNDAIPSEYREVAEALFPTEGFSDGNGPAEADALAFAEILGIGWDYRRLLNAEMFETADFLSSFRNNIELLIQKTWVDKADEFRKEKLEARVPPFITLIESADYRAALQEFGSILDELANLFFGPQSRKDDFTEYTMRIDEQMGLFWWYGAQLDALSSIEDERCFYSILLIGLCYLTNF